MKYKIYQLKDIGSSKYAFMSLKFAKERGFSLQDYKLVYEGDLDKEFKSINEALEYLFTIFNTKHPADYQGHSLSVSDVVRLDDNIYYCDSYSWEEIK